MSDFKKTFEEGFSSDFKNSSDIVDDIVANGFGVKQVERIKFGVPFLDKAIKGAAKNDLFVIAAKTGVGKSELCTTITISALRQGKRVYYFALEYSYGEVEERMFYRIISKKFWDDPEKPKLKFSWTYDNFRDGKLWVAVNKYKTEAAAELKEQNKNLFIFYKTKDFDLDAFQKQFARIRGSVDLVVIDHLNYFDFGEGENEFRGASQIVKAIRAQNQISEIPIILVSHVRKSHYGDKRVIPSVEDIYGSSDIFKVATCCVLIGPDYITDAGKRDPANMASTWIHVAKRREDSSITRYIGRQDFNLRKNSYDGSYDLFKLVKGGTEVEFIPLIASSEEEKRQIPRFMRGDADEA